MVKVILELEEAYVIKGLLEHKLVEHNRVTREEPIVAERDIDYWLALQNALEILNTALNANMEPK